MIPEVLNPICLLETQPEVQYSSSYSAIYQRKYEVGLEVRGKQCRLLEIDAHDLTSRANAAVMSNIKKRLKDAYDNVTFYANKTWTNDCYLYQKTNQELYARHIKIQEAFTEEVTRPRTVRDSIPQSKLAKYSNYVYDEARELSYTPNTNDMMFHYTCRCKDGVIEEPWMLPEVEQLFIWLTYSRDFNLLRYRDLVHFDQVETNKTKHTCTLEDFHKVDPRFFENFERTPGKARFTKAAPIKDNDLKCAIPPVLNFTTFDDMTVKMKFNLDSIKNLWKTARSDDLVPLKRVEIFKSSFDNLFIDEDPKAYKYYFNSDKIPYHFNELQEKANDFRNLQGLTEMLKRIKEPNDGDLNLLRSTCRTASDTLLKSTPAKRLYSDVVQGLANKNATKTQFAGESVLTKSESCKDIRFPTVKLTAVDDMEYKFSSPSKSKPLSNSPTWLEESWGKHEIKLLQKPEEKKSDVPQTAKLTTNCQSLYAKSFPTTLANTDTFTNNPITCYGNNFVNYQSFCPTNSAVTEYQPAEMYGTYNPANVYAGNYYSPLQYQNNNLYCNSYSTANLASNPYAYSPMTYTSQLSSNARNFIQQKQNTVHYNTGQQQWIMHQYRTPSLYNINHIPPQPCFLLPPQLPKQQRWMPAGHYVRSPTPQTFHVNATPPHTPPQNWNVQGQLYRTSSTQHICPQSQVFETSSLDNSSRQKYKSRKINSQINIIVNKARSKSPENHSADKIKCNTICKKSISSEIAGSPGTSKLFANSSANDVMEYKLIVKKNSLSTQSDAKVLSSALKDFDSESKPLPVITTNSDDLERQALEEYQSSNESFYKDLERQAEEQYEDSENSLGPPNEDLYFGGRASLCEYFSVYFSDLLTTYFEVYIYHYA